jgi:hypothetical protein
MVRACISLLRSPQTARTSFFLETLCYCRFSGEKGNLQKRGRVFTLVPFLLVRFRMWLLLIPIQEFVSDGVAGIKPFLDGFGRAAAALREGNDGF